MRGSCFRFFGRWPLDWEETIAVIVGQLGIQPSEAMEFDIDDLIFWSQRTNDFIEWSNNGAGSS